jgi:hypothetical protein
LETITATAAFWESFSGRENRMRMERVGEAVDHSGVSCGNQIARKKGLSAIAEVFCSAFRMISARCFSEQVRGSLPIVVTRVTVPGGKGLRRVSLTARPSTLVGLLEMVVR